MVAETYEYASGRNGVSCTYIPPASSVDMFLADAYQPTPTGKGLAQDPEWLGWLRCVRGHGRPLGLAEYGIGTGSGDAVRRETLKVDDAYLKASFPDFQIWSYGWVDDSKTEGPLRDLQFTDSATITEWKAIETGS